MKRLFGHYARILVDIDFSKKIFHETLVEREGGSYPTEVVYERILDFCSHCQILGHDVTNCRWLYPRKEDMSKDRVAKGKMQIPTKKPHSNPNVQHGLDLWMRVREYDKANAARPFTPVLSRKQKQQCRVIFWRSRLFD